MTKYWVLVDNFKVGQIETLVPLNEIQKLSAAQIYGKKHGITNFGINGIRLIKAVNKDDYKINQMVKRG
jgi:hypothetical protein